MKLIIAIIRPERLQLVQEELQAVLDESDKYRLTVAHVEGHGAQQGEVEYFRGRPVRQHLHPRLQITIAVNDAYVEKTVDAIVRGARTGDIGDGKIFVQPLEDCVRIRTGQRGGAAI